MSPDADNTQEHTASHLSKVTIDHAQIRRWAESQGAKPGRVKAPGGSPNTGMIQLEFPEPGEKPNIQLDEISWDEFFRVFEEKQLALVYEDKVTGGRQGHYSRLVNRDSAAAKG